LKFEKFIKIFFALPHMDMETIGFLRRSQRDKLDHLEVVGEDPITNSFVHVEESWNLDVA
jgi:hypothetical protein